MSIDVPRLTRAARRAQAAALWSGGFSGRRHPAGVANTGRNTDDILRFNLDQIVAALSAAGLDPFVVPSAADDAPRVGVAATDGPGVLAALRAARTEAPLYVKAPGLPVARAAAVDIRYAAATATLRVFTYHHPAGGGEPIGKECACVIEVWSRLDGAYVGPRPNPIATKVPEDFATPCEIEVLGRDYPSWRAFDVPDHVERMPFDIDLVYTWVDGSDDAWRTRLDDAKRDAGHEDWHPAAANRGRYTDREELRYSLRSVWMYANFFRRIHVVTDRQVPAWLASHPRIAIVDHREIFGEAGRLPTFNSHAIEARLHHIDGLTEHFVYLNDDMFIGRRLSPRAFFASNGLTKFLPAPFELSPEGATEQDNPAEVAGKNNRALLRQRHPGLVTHKLRHAPYPLRRSILFELEQTYPAELAATASHQFRHPQDYSVASSLFHYYAYLSGKAVPTQLSFAYVDISRPATRPLLAALRRIQRERPQVFCVNDVAGDVPPEHEDTVRSFFETMFPVPSPYEQ